MGGSASESAAVPPAVVAINALEEELEEAARLCRREGIGLEVTAFAYPAHLDGGFRSRVERHATLVEGVSPVLCHGPFLDLYGTSPDPKVAAVARERHGQALEAAAEIGAVVYVAHLNSIPLIRNRAYRSRFVSAAVEFWAPLADRAGRAGITVVLENLWEPGPELQKAVVERAGHPHLRASFDNGHALVFSDRSAKEWIAALGEDLGHLHLHDNDGTYDEHLPVGEGSEDWSSLLEACRRHAPGAVLVAESDQLEVNRRSLEALRGLLGSGGDGPRRSGSEGESPAGGVEEGAGA